MLGLLINWLYDLDIHIGYMEVVVLEDDTILDFAFLIKSEDSLSDMPGTQLMESLKVQGGYLATDLGGNGRAGITNEVLHVENFDR